MNARYAADGRCELVDHCGSTASWRSAKDWADAWLEEWRGDEHGSASQFIDEMTDAAAPGVVELLVVLAERAAVASDELSWVGAGPLEDLLAHSGNGPAAVDAVERAWRHHPPFKEALTNVRVGHGIRPDIRARLVALGAREAHGA